MSFTHLHLHTEYSMLDGIQRIKTLAKTLKSQGVSSVALTDHGNMHAAIEFYDILTNPKKYKIQEEFNIKPIIGMEAYIHTQEELDDISTKRRHHLILLAKNEEGYKNLMYLSSMSFIKGFYYKPRINRKILSEHSSGLICSSACLAGEINFHLNPKNESRGALGYEGAKEAALWYKDVFKDDFYIEIMRLGFNEQRLIDDDIIRLSQELSIPLVATNDVHYTLKSDASAQDLFMCIGTKQTINTPNRLSHPTDEMYLKTPEEMEILFADIPEAIENTQKIANECNLKIKLGDPTPPNFKFALDYAKEFNLSLPEPNEIFSLQNDITLFEYRSRQGLDERLKFIPKEKHQIYKDRLEEEIKIINNMKFPGYMLIVADFINEAKKRGIPVGPGRGSAAGSLVAYSLKITDLDPIPYNLLFERFLNPERVSLPDIDVDFCQKRRGEIIDYVIEKYGKYNVAQVATFGKLLAKGVVRDVARVMDMPYSEADKMAKLIPNELKITLDDAFKKEEKIKELLDNNNLAKQIWDYSLKLEGLNRNTGMHAAGVVISNEEIWNKAPLFKQSNSDDEHFVTQYSKDYLEAVDLIKFDFLGLKNLTIIDDAIKLIKNRFNKDINWQEVDFNEKRVYDTIQSGDTLGIFQIESSGMQALAQKLRPDCFEDVIAMLALYRPGPLNSGMVDDFIQRKHKEKEISYMFEELKDILEPTYGVIVYQEQVMQIVQLIGGFSLGGADLVRRAMGKKDKKILDNLKNEYLEGAKKNGFDVKKSDDLFELILKFAEYGFNKSHSAAYAMITFQTAYLKTYYPAEFMAALLTSESGNSAKVVKYIKESERLGIKVKRPSINLSDHEFSVINDGKEIIFGFSAIKGVGSIAIENLIDERKNSNYNDMDDFVNRIDGFKVNKKVIEALCKAGALDELGKNRNTILSNIDNITSAIKDKATIKKDLQNSLFSGVSDGDDVKVEFNNLNELDLKTLLNYEKESTGFYFSGHPLNEYEEEINAVSYTPSFEFDDLDGSGQIIIVGKIEDLEIKSTKTGKKMGIIKFLDLFSDFEILSFDDKLKDIESLDFDKPIALKVRYIRDERNNKDDAKAKLNFSLLEVLTLDEAKELNFKKVSFKKPKNNKKEISINMSYLTKDRINQIYQILSSQSDSKNSYRVDLKILDDDKFYIYETNFFVKESFNISNFL